MAVVALSDWDRFGVCLPFDAAAGLVVDEQVEGPAHGFVVRSQLGEQKGPWRWAAVYSGDGRLWLQIDARRWDVDAVEIVHTRSPDGGFCTFRVSDASGVQFDLSYVSARLDPLNRADPSFDDLDEENQDFFLWLARMLQDSEWSAGMIKVWEGGFDPGR